MENKNILRVDEKTFLGLPIVDTSVALEVCDIRDFSTVKQKLEKLYGDVTVVANGIEMSLKDIAVATEVYVPPQADFDKERYNMADVMRVTARLTREDGGCPWDKAQTHDSIRINLIEEAYEAVDAIDKRDRENMREEFGDVLLQSVLQSDIARRAGEFDFDDVCDELSKKLIGRHTFIFGEDSAGNADEALTYWEKAKGKEKHYDSVKNQLQRLPDSFPSLLLCQKVYKKLKKAGLGGDPRKALDAALTEKDYATALSACVALIVDGGGDAEVELNKLMKKRIAEL